MHDLVADGTTIVLTTQYLEEADRLVLVDGGRVAASGSAAELKRRVGGERIDLHFAAAAVAEAASRTLAAAGAQLGPDGATVHLRSDGSAAKVRHVLDVLADARIEAASLSQHEPTLDDVFVALTGAGRR